ncbi:hypothetical protein BC941DRAFT_474254 [Chlamydoabsidia padenii]|nr:hypothetical protein BC941DRAFT_474254 [Chlamydoabsidia padenii]
MPVGLVNAPTPDDDDENLATLLVKLSMLPIKFEPGKVAPIIKYLASNNLSELQTFLGLAGGDRFSSHP